MCIKNILLVSNKCRHFISWSMKDYFLIAQIFGILAFLVSIISVLQKNRSKYIYFNLTQNVFSGVQYFFLSKIIACYLCGLTIIRLIVYNFKDRYNKIAYIIILIVFVTANILISLINFSVWYDIFPIIASTLVCFSVWQNSIVFIKIAVIITKVLWGIYACITRAYFSIAMDIFMIIWTIIFLCKQRNLKTQKNKQLVS